MSFARPIWTRFLPTDTVLLLARVGPLGRMRRAPGTWGSVGGLLYHLAVYHWVSPLWVILASLLSVWLAAALCAEAEFRLGRSDPGEIVLDEFVAIPLCFLGWPHVESAFPAGLMPWGLLLAGFALFRFFDILKPLGIARLQALPGGWGVVADDVGAALATCASLHGIAYLVRTYWPLVP